MALIKLNNRSIKDVTSLPFGVGNLIHISSQTASNSASISFTTGINSTYKEYQFYFIDIHPRTDSVLFQFNLSTDTLVRTANSTSLPSLVAFNLLVPLLVMLPNVSTIEASKNIVFT